MITETKLLIFSLNAILFAFFFDANGIFSQIRPLRLFILEQAAGHGSRPDKDTKKASQNGLLEIVAEARLERTTSRL